MCFIEKKIKKLNIQFRKNKKNKKGRHQVASEKIIKMSGY